MSLKKSSRTGPAAFVSACFALFLFCACIPTHEKGHTYLEIQPDAAWADFDILIISWKDPASSLGGDWFTGSPDAFGPSQKVLADGYKGQKIEITVEGVKAGKTVHVEVLQYDGNESKVEAIRHERVEGTDLDYDDSPITLGEKDSANLPDVDVTPEILFDKSLQWTSSNAKVFVVEDKRIIAKGIGSATLTGQLVSNPEKSFDISVTVRAFTAPVEKVSFTTRSLTLFAGGSADIPDVDVVPDNADPRLEYKSSDEAKARIENGKIIGLVAGDVSVLAQSLADASKRDTLQVTVKAEPINGDPIPAAPTISSLSVGDAKATVSWAAVEGATRYNLYYTAGATVSSAGTKVAGAVSPLEVSGLINGTQYAFSLTALSPAGESPLGAVVTATPKASAPGAPTNVAAVGGYFGKVTITWSPVAGAIAYHVYMRIGSIVEKLDHRYSGVTSPFVATDLSPDKGYAFAVTAVSSTGESELSNVALASPAYDPPGIPRMNAAASLKEGIGVAWFAGDSATSHNLYYAAGTSVTLAGTKLADAVSPKLVTGLAMCADYTFAATAVNSKGESALSANPITAVWKSDPPTVTAASGNLGICVSGKADFSVAATGTRALNYQWRKGTVAIPGATSAAFSIPSVSAADSGSYSCLVGSGCSDKVASTPAVLTLRTEPKITSIQVDPLVQKPGDYVTIWVREAGSAPFKFQWRRNGIDIPGEDYFSIRLDGVTLADNNSVFTCFVTNGCGTGVLSDPITLKVSAPVETGM